MYAWNKDSYLRTNPAADEAEIRRIVAQLRSSHLNPVTLANLVELGYECCLQSGELIGLSVGDAFLYRSWTVRDNMRVSERVIDLSNEAKRIVQCQVNCLKTNHFSLKGSSPLFADRKGKKYHQRVLRDQLKESCSGGFVRLGLIRQSGICRYYEALKSTGVSPRPCLNRTAEFAGMSVKQSLFPIVKKIVRTRFIFITKNSDY